MVEFIGKRVRTIPNDMTLSVERVLHNKTWRFVMIVPQSFWEDLFHWNAPDTKTQSAWDAYKHEQTFWNDLAERNADVLSKTAEPKAAKRRMESMLNNYPWLEAEYAKTKRS